MNFSEAATGGVLWKKRVLKNFAIITGKLLTCNLFKRDSNTGVFLWILLFFKNTYFEEHLLTAAFDFLKQLQNTGEQLLLMRCRVLKKFTTCDKLLVQLNFCNVRKFTFCDIKIFCLCGKTKLSLCDIIKLDFCDMKILTFCDIEKN